MKKSGRFNSLIQVRAEKTTTPAKKTTKTTRRTTVPAAAELIGTSQQELVVVSRRAKIGKRSDPNYHQTTTYLRKDLWEKVQGALIGKDYDWSDLANQLAAEWLKDQVGK